MEDLSLITTEREHLFVLTHHIVQAIHPGELMDCSRPVEIDVTGSNGAGKSIFSDAAIEYLLGSEAIGQQKSHSRESWIGLRAGIPLQIRFSNVANMDYILSSPIERMHGGIDFIQNCPLHTASGGIKIHIEQPGNPSSRSDILESERAPIISAFNHLSKQPWTRYLRISINENLARHPEMAGFMASVRISEVPVYGLSVFR